MKPAIGNPQSALLEEAPRLLAIARERGWARNLTAEEAAAKAAAMPNPKATRQPKGRPPLAVQLPATEMRLKKWLAIESHRLGMTHSALYQRVNDGLPGVRLRRESHNVTFVLPADPQPTR